ncbi:MAG: GIY-YIG nuclease family protein [Desulfovibrio sp.]|nr:GIY-YIG nuclease family protein [Desulfovibrio sp.]
MGAGFIYVLTNPSFPGLVKIGYADVPERRVEELNRSEGLPRAFRLYCTLEVPDRLADKDVHAIIDRLNPGLRVKETVGGRRRVREFYRMSADDARALLENIAGVAGGRDRLKLHASPADGCGAAGMAEPSVREEVASGTPAEPGDVRSAGEGFPAAGDGDSSLLYAEIERRVLAYGDVWSKPSKTDGVYQAFYVEGKKRRFLKAERQNTSVKLYLMAKGFEMHDPKKMTAPNHTHARPEEELLARVRNMAELEDAMLLIRQSYESVKT